MPTDEPDDQMRTTTYGMANGKMTQMTAATMKATHPMGSVYSFAKTFTWHSGRSLLQFHRGQSYHLDPALKAALLAAGAPMTAA